MGEDERVPEDMPQHKRQRTGSDEEGHGADKSVPQTPGHKEHTAADSSEVGEGSGSAAKGDLEKAQGQPLDAPEDPTQDAQKDEDKQDKAPDAADDAPFLPMPGVGGSAGWSKYVSSRWIALFRYSESTLFWRASTTAAHLVDAA